MLLVGDINPTIFKRRQNQIKQMEKLIAWEKNFVDDT
jgi:hypothetical protein